MGDSAASIAEDTENHSPESLLDSVPTKSEFEEIAKIIDGGTPFPLFIAIS